MMKLALPLVVVIGLAVGGLMPVRPSAPAAPAAAAAPTVAALEPAKAAPAPRPVDNPIETVLARENNGHFFAHAEVNGTMTRFVIDTGATMVALTEDDARRAGISFSPMEYEVIGSGASGAVRGQMVKLDNVVLDGKRFYDVTGAVVQGLDVSLLGQSYLQRLQSIQIQGDTMRLK